MVWRVVKGVSYKNSTQFQFGSEMTVSVRNRNYLMEGGKIYYEDKSTGKKLEITGVDQDSLVFLNDVYSKDKNNVYYKNVILDYADPATFEKHEVCDSYLSDDKNCSLYRDVDDMYIYGVVFEDIDPDRFEPLIGEVQSFSNRGGYWTDGEGVFYSRWDKESQYLLELKEADPEQVEFFEKNMLLKDFVNNKVYSFGDFVEGAEADSFEPFVEEPFNDYTVFYVDNDNVFFDGCYQDDCGLSAIEGMDGASFEVVILPSDDVLPDSLLLKDKNAYYYIGIEDSNVVFVPIEGVDRESFEIVDGYLFRDKYRLYRLANFVYDANSYYFDFATYEIGAEYELEMLNPNYYILDGQVYFADQVMDGVVTENLEVFEEDPSDAFARDGVNIYYAGRVIEGADYESFEVLHRFCAQDDNYIYGLNYSEFDKAEDKIALDLQKYPVDEHDCNYINFGF